MSNDYVIPAGSAITAKDNIWLDYCWITLDAQPDDDNRKKYAGPMNLRFSSAQLDQLEKVIHQRNEKVRLAQIAKDEWKIWRKEKQAEMELFKTEIVAECEEKKKELMRNLGLKEEELPYLSDDF